MMIDDYIVFLEINILKNDGIWKVVFKFQSSDNGIHEKS